MTLHTAFRMERSLFNDLVVYVQKVWDADMGPHAHIASKQASCSSGSPVTMKTRVAVTMKTRVAVTLRWLAGGNYWDIIIIHLPKNIRTYKSGIPEERIAY